MEQRYYTYFGSKKMPYLITYYFDFSFLFHVVIKSSSSCTARAFLESNLIASVGATIVKDCPKREELYQLLNKVVKVIVVPDITLI